MSESAFSAWIIFGGMALMIVWSLSGSYLTEERLKPNWMSRLFVGHTVLLFVALGLGIAIESRYGQQASREFSFWYMHAGPPVWMIVILAVAIFCDGWKKWLEVWDAPERRAGVYYGRLPNDMPQRLDLLAELRTEEARPQKLSGVVVTEDWEAGMEFGEDGETNLHYEALSLTPADRPK